MEARTEERFERGRELFNAGRFFEAHEAWEEAWLVERGQTRVLLQGLIQVAAGRLKAERGNAAGCARLLAAASEKLDVVAAAYGLGGFARAVADGCARSLNWERGEAPDAGPPPVLPALDSGPGRETPAR